MPTIEYQGSDTPSAARRHRCAWICVLAAICTLPCSIALSVRSLVLDHRGNAIYRQREREDRTI